MPRKGQRLSYFHGTEEYKAIITDVDTSTRVDVVYIDDNDELRLAEDAEYRDGAAYGTGTGTGSGSSGSGDNPPPSEPPGGGN